jgi:hypothetical protein
MMGFRAAPVLRASIVKWAENQPGMRTLSEATRRLVELGLTVKTKVRQSSEGQKLRAREMADDAIDSLTMLLLIGTIRLAESVVCLRDRRIFERRELITPNLSRQMPSASLWSWG